MERLVHTSFKISNDALEALKSDARRLSFERHEDVSVGGILRDLVRDYLATPPELRT